MTKKKQDPLDPKKQEEREEQKLQRETKEFEKAFGKEKKD